MSETEESEHPIRQMIRRVRAAEEQLDNSEGSEATDSGETTWQQAGVTPGSTEHSQLLGLASILEDRSQLGEVDAIRPDLPNRIGRFEIKRVLGAGGFGWVLLADDPQLNRPIALKVPRLDTLVSQIGRARFLREARAAALLTHPNLVSVYEAGQVGPILYIAFEWVDGPSLSQWLTEHRDELSDVTIAALMASLARAVHHAHQRGIIHRDLKPSNVLLKTDNAQSNLGPRVLAECAKITDFGLAFLAEGEGELTRSGALVGTPKYMAPEQIESSGVQSAPTIDVYGLGAVMYELLTGQPPFSGSTLASIVRAVEQDAPRAPRKHHAHVSKDLEAICLKCLEKKPERRYSSAAALADDLERFVEGLPVRARLPSLPERVWRWVLRNRMVSVAFAFALVSLTVGMSVSIYQANRATVNLEESLQQRDRAQRHRDRAEAVVDSLLNEVSESLEPVPQMQPLRRKLLELALTHERAAMTDVGEDVESQLRVGESLGRISDLLYRMGKFDEAKNSCLESERMLNGLETSDTKQEEQRVTQLFKAMLLRSRILQQQGHEAEAVSVLQELLVKAEPQPIPNLARLFATAQHYYGITIRDQGDSAAAERAFLESISLLQSIPEEQRTPGDWRDIVNVQSMIGGLRYVAGKYDEAVEIWKEVVELEVDLDPSVPQQNILRGNRAASLANLAMAYSFKRDFQMAHSYYQRSNEQYQQLCEEFPLHYDHASGRLTAMVGRSVNLQNAGQSKLAIESYREAIAWGEQLLQRFGEQPRLLMEVGRASGNLGNVLIFKNLEAEAIEAWNRNLNYAKKRAQLHPEHVMSHSDLTFAINNLVAFYLRKDRIEEAKSLLEEAIPVAEQALRVGPDNQAVINSVVSLRGNQSLYQCLSGEQDQALATIDSILSLQPENAETIFTAAKYAGRCQIAVTGNLHQRFGQANDAEVAERFAVRALELLELAKQKGLRDFPRVKREPEFTELLGRSGFQSLLDGTSASQEK